MDEIGVVLRDDATGGEAGRHALPPHARERLIADAHLKGIVARALPNDGAPLAEASLCVDPEGDPTAPLEVALRSGGASYRRRYSRLAVGDDVQVLVCRLHASGTLAAGTYRFELDEPAAAGPAAAGSGSEGARPSGLRIRPFPRALPRLPRVSLADAGIEGLPRCGHPALFVPRRRARQLRDQAAATPDVEVGALLLARPFLIAEDVPCPLGIYLDEAVPLAEGTVGSAVQLRIPPAALAAVPAEERPGRLRAGLAHSHPAVELAALERAADADPRAGTAEPDGPSHATGGFATSLWLSAHDKAFATAFWWQPWHVQIVIDSRQTDCARALGAFCWVDARIGRVCFQLLDELSERIPGE